MLALTASQIDFLNRICPKKWTVTNNIVDITRSVDIQHINLTNFPVKFGNIKGKFDCSHNQLTNLEGGPKTVSGYYSCSNNKLTSLIGAPSIIFDIFSCNYNQLTSLEGAPKEVVGLFACSYNKLTDLNGCPKLIKNDLSCHNNPNLYILYGIGKVVGDVIYSNENELNEWIIKQARKDIFSSYSDIAEWIKRNNKLEYLLHAQQQIREHFSPRILHLVDNGIYNESKILNYKKFSSLC